MEKVFQVQAHRFGVYADTLNLFNANAVTARVRRRTRAPAAIAYKSPTGIQGARQITFGGRWSFLDPRGFAPRTPRHALSRAASAARSVRVASLAALAR